MLNGPLAQLMEIPACAMQILINGKLVIYLTYFTIIIYNDKTPFYDELKNPPPSLF